MLLELYSNSISELWTWSHKEINQSDCSAIESQWPETQLTLRSLWVTGGSAWCRIDRAWQVSVKMVKIKSSLNPECRFSFISWTTWPTETNKIITICDQSFDMWLVYQTCWRQSPPPDYDIIRGTFITHKLKFCATWHLPAWPEDHRTTIPIIVRSSYDYRWQSRLNAPLKFTIIVNLRRFEEAKINT